MTASHSHEARPSVLRFRMCDTLHLPARLVPRLRVTSPQPPSFRECVAAAFVLISKLYRQMDANTGITTDSARVSRANRWARLIAEGAIGRASARDSRSLGKAVRAHGGEIRIRNMPGGGCVFIIEVPLAAAESASQAVS